MSTPTVSQRRWTRAEFDRMVDLGVFAPEERIELLDGMIFTMTPQKSAHSATIGKSERALQRVFGPDCWVRVQMPFVVDPDSEPEPDLVVVDGAPEDFALEHPRVALLIVEVSDTTLEHDRIRKALTYARAGVPEYWILNLVDECLEVHRDPAPSSGDEDGYGTREVLSRGDSVSPLHRPSVPIRVDDLLA